MVALPHAQAPPRRGGGRARLTFRPFPEPAIDPDSQIVVPPSFVQLFVPPHRIKPTEPLATIAARHEFCEDLAQMLTEQASATKFRLGVTEADVLERIERGLREDGSVVSPAEAGWVVGRLAELLDWPWTPPGEAPAA